MKPYTFARTWVGFIQWKVYVQILTLLLSLMEEMEDEGLLKLLKPIRSHIDDILVPFRQVELIYAELLISCLSRSPALVLSWHHDHLSYQSHGKKKQYH